MSGAWETVVGLEVHLQLLTKSKMFCACSTNYGDPPNTNVCPVCLGMPGALPTPNEHAVRLAVRAAYALGCTVHERSVFARKNYFYPDLPKGYQISQFEEPLATGGRLEIVSPDRGPITIGITRVHIEEDAGKSFHDKVPGMTAVDFNRSGVPLIEIVSEPDMRSPAEARAYLTALKQIMRYAEVSDCNMEEGSLRVDANVSVHQPGTPFGTRTEVKNMNSFSGVERALAFERDRQIAAIGRGETIVQRTMTFNAADGSVRPMRTKEQSHDYRYFPEPDLPPLVLKSAWIGEVKAALPELPAARRDRFMAAYGLSAVEAAVVTATKEIAGHFEAFVAAVGAGSGKDVWNWEANDVLAHSADGETIPAALAPARLAELFALVRQGTVSRQASRKALAEMLTDAAAPADIAARLGLVQVQDTSQIATWVRETLAAHPGEVARYQAGEAKLMGFLVGQVMKRSQGKADPKAVSAALAAALAGDPS
jgi:aspartyl-tRNA(Asn)/glutamyl-tRNA(Gln) amidotransferase subunit B